MRALAEGISLFNPSEALEIKPEFTGQRIW